MHSGWAPVTALALAGCLAGEGAAADHQALQAKMRQAWETVVATCYSPRTSLFYTTPPDQVPSAAQYAAREPNVHGGGTGGEDCAMFGGILLAAMCDQFEVTGDEAVRQHATMVFDGLKLLATVHGEPGFIARGVCVEDGRSIYPGSSRDQYTHVVHGLWRFDHSPLVDDGQRQAIREILAAVADKMTRDVTFENGYCFKFAYGVPDDRGVSRMRNVRVHEAARLPMCYAAAWDVARRDDDYRRYRECLPLAVHQSLDFAATPEAELKRWVPPYSVLQMQTSLELLLAVETESVMADAIRRAMRQVSDYVETSPLFALADRDQRDRGEIVEGQLMSPDYRLSAQRQAELCDAIERLPADRYPGAVYTLLGAYWRARREGWLQP